MKIQKQLSRKLGGKTYYKYVVILPEDLIKSSEIKEGQELEYDSKKGEIVLKLKQ